MRYLDAAARLPVVRRPEVPTGNLFRHRRLAREPMVVVLWQLGFVRGRSSASAIGWGTRPGPHERYPWRGASATRDLAFDSLLQVLRTLVQPAIASMLMTASGQSNAGVTRTKRSLRQHRFKFSSPSRATDARSLGRLGRRLCLSVD